jgi:hypothetical protein
MRDWSELVDTNHELAVLQARLKWPAPELLDSLYRKLLENPGSCVVLTLEAPRAPDGPQWKVGWLSSEERDCVRKALQKLNTRRIKHGVTPTSEPP